MLNSGIAVLPMAFVFPLPFSKLANYSVPMIDYAIDQIRAWVNPTDFDTALIRARKLQEDVTTARLLGNIIFEQWISFSKLFRPKGSSVKIHFGLMVRMLDALFF